MNKRKRLFTLLITFLTIAPVLVRSAPKDDSHMEWWRDARYGMFIHWGLYSIAGGEWKGKDYGKEQGGASAEWLMKSADISKEEYRATLTPQFNPTSFDAEEWVSVAKEAGMKYVVITSKHHDGFALFDTEATDYDVMDATPFKRDIIKELSEECAKQGLRFGVYYSQTKDWYHRGLGKGSGTLSNEDYLELVQIQLDELLSKYGDMAVLWFDTGGSNLIEADAQGARVRELQPDTVICSRLYSRRVPLEDRRYADFESLPDRMLPAELATGDSETCMTLRHNWGYDRNDDAWKSSKDVVEFLALCAARGVNLLLNVGPTPEGTLLPEEIDRLTEVGAWMKENGDAIYGTQQSPLDYDFWWGAMTRKENKLYLHVLEWKREGIEFNGIAAKPSKAYFLADPKQKPLPLIYDAKGAVTKVKVPAKAPDSKNTVIVVEYAESIVVDSDAKGKYHWYTNRRTRHTDIEKSEAAGRHALPQAVTGN
ncbi:alpha-L-fucosidase [Pelagicoccus sp. SDUM812005]|uniref:alpha-L-fucosidase n=1 Tax=Pelagicoccus sp. SDUM812005 TaxID=3041257 RepID=UPI00280E09EC|nr:alpha-L-fucosidase [Pelagicoccus sp. SDUM812005]MDQ8183495.1 alpha-L-fucosidase [Pelagicoccus sp. SDUM812005]